jgi:hypothetical protein
MDTGAMGMRVSHSRSGVRDQVPRRLLQIKNGEHSISEFPRIEATVIHAAALSVCTGMAVHVKAFL